MKRQYCGEAASSPTSQLISHITTAIEVELMNRPSRTAITVMALLLSASICVFFALASVFAEGGEMLQVPFLVGEERVDLIYEYGIRILMVNGVR